MLYSLVALHCTVWERALVYKYLGDIYSCVSDVCGCMGLTGAIPLITADTIASVWARVACSNVQ